MFTKLPLDGVPKAGVTNVGLVAKTNDPVPVSSVTAAARFALDGVAKNVATPVPKPLTPVLMGKPVVFVKTPLAGVPRAGAVNVGLVNVTPVNVVTVAPKATLVDPIVTVELVNAAFPMLVSVLVDPLIDLLVSVWVPVSVATTDVSIAIVTAVAPV